MQHFLFFLHDGTKLSKVLDCLVNFTDFPLRKGEKALGIGRMQIGPDFVDGHMELTQRQDVFQIRALLPGIIPVVVFPLEGREKSPISS